MGVSEARGVAAEIRGDELARGGVSTRFGRVEKARGRGVHRLKRHVHMTDEATVWCDREAGKPMSGPGQVLARVQGRGAPGPVLVNPSEFLFNTL